MSPLPKPPKEVPVCRATIGLAPKFKAKLDRVLARMRGQGHDPMIFETHRTEARQRFLYGFGREYDDGRGKVTFSKAAGNTWHAYWLAADIISESKLWGAPDAFWQALGAACRMEGLRWGADWDMDGDWTDESFTDRPHVQWGAPMRRSPSPRAAELKAQGGYEAVWKEVGAA